MTEQQAQNPIDDLYRKTFENLPPTPSASGWDTPSDQVWEHIKNNIQPTRRGWSAQSWALLATLMIGLAAGMYWMLTRQTVHPAETPPSMAVPPQQEQQSPAVITPASTSDSNHPVDIVPKTSGGINKTKTTPPPPPEEKGKPELNTAQPLPGSKTTLPPNTTEAKKKTGN